jgi:hypothetical protein
MVEQGMLSARDARMMTPDFYKPAGERCPHQRHHKGCMIYPRRPFGCRMWSCRWLTGQDTEHLRRPDHSHYVIDISPDFVTADFPSGRRQVPVLQIWLDPDYPHAYHDPALRAYLAGIAKREGMAALIRLNSSDAFLLAAPSLSGTGDWCEIRGAKTEQEHTIDEKLAALGPIKVVFKQG